MNKIINKLLSVTFPNVNVEALMEVIVSTPNPEVACEILCGLYVEPLLPQFVISRRANGVLQFISFDKWNSSITYSYQRPETKSSYFPKGTKKEDINMSNFDELKVNSSSNAEYFSIPTGVMETCTSTMSLKDWMEATVVGDPS